MYSEYYWILSFGLQENPICTITIENPITVTEYFFLHIIEKCISNVFLDLCKRKRKREMKIIHTVKKSIKKWTNEHSKKRQAK